MFSEKCTSRVVNILESDEIAWLRASTRGLRLSPDLTSSTADTSTLNCFSPRKESREKPIGGGRVAVLVVDTRNPMQRV